MSNIFDEISAEDKEEYLLNEEYLLEEIIKNKLEKIKKLDDANLIRIKIGQMVSKQILKDKIERSRILYILKLCSNKQVNPIINKYMYFWQDKVLLVTKQFTKQVNTFGNSDSLEIKEGSVYQSNLIDFEIVGRFQIQKDMDIGISILNKKAVNLLDFSCSQNYRLIERVINIPYIINDYTTLNINVYSDYITLNIDISLPHMLIDRIYQQITNDIIELLGKINNIFT